MTLLFQIKKIEDVPGFIVYPLLRESWQHWKDSGQSDADLYNFLHFWGQSYRRRPGGNVCCLVLLLGDQAVAMSSLSFQENDFVGFTPRLADLYVRQSQRGQGYGQLLSRILLEQAQNLGYSQVYLLAGPETVVFHQKNGFSWFLKDYNIMMKKFCS